jgi:hypothetical protein
MQVLESSVTTMYSDGSKKTREIEGELRTDGKKDFSPIGRKHIEVKPGVEMREFNSSEFQEFCEFHNQKLSLNATKIVDSIFETYPDRDDELHMLIILLFGYDYMAQGLDDHKFHFSNPCSVEEVLSTLQGINTSCQKLLRKFDNGLLQD